jgi:dTDP-4-amino-4,6-dideoxygalactose transaminase
MKKKTGKQRKLIPLARPYFDKAEEKAVISVIRSGWVTQGPKVEELENLVKEYVGAENAVAVSSATTALFLSLYLKGIAPGDEVIVPSFSFIASANVIVHVGAKPVFIDIDPKTYNLDPEKIEGLITKKTRAIIAVDQVGLPCNLDRIRQIAAKHKLFVLEDAACAIGSQYQGRKIGSISEVTCFSFHPRKLVTTGDGGMIVTNSQKLANRARILRHQGMGISDMVRHKSKVIIHEKYPEIGFNFRMTDIEAAVGIEQMKKLPRALKEREKLAKRYDQAFSKSKYLTPPFIPEGYLSNRQTYIIRLSQKAKITRDGLMQKLLTAGIATRRGVMASHLEAPYRKLLGRISLPETEKAVKETIAVPLYPRMTINEQDDVIEKILKYIQ